MPQLGFSSASLPEVAAHPTVRSDKHPTKRANVETHTVARSLPGKRLGDLEEDLLKSRRPLSHVVPLRIRTSTQ